MPTFNITKLFSVGGLPRYYRSGNCPVSQRDKLGHFCIASFESFLVSFLRQAGSVDTFVSLPGTAGPQINIAVIHLQCLFPVVQKRLTEAKL